VNAKEYKILNALVYFIIIITVLMLSPLIYKAALNYSNNRVSSAGANETVSDRNTKSRKYTVSENTVDISSLRTTEYGVLNLVKAAVTDSGNIILLCSSREEIQVNDGVNEDGTVKTRTEYEDVMRIASVKNITLYRNVNETENRNERVSGSPDIINAAAGDIEIYRNPVRNNFLESLRNDDYIFKDYKDGTFFISNNKAAFLFDILNMRVEVNYSYPPKYNIYQAALSNNKEMLALATEEGFYIGNLQGSNMIMSPSNMKELIATVTVNGVKMSVRNPVWSDNDERIYYRLYADSHVRNAGVTTVSPGGNEQLTALDSSNFIFLNHDNIFYYFSSGTDTGLSNLFRCGYFNAYEKKMNDVMKSQVYYFDIDVSSNGTHLAALSNNGNIKKISVIDIRTKKLIYSSLYDDVYDFSFSPNEKNVIIYGRADNKRTLKIINIDWAEE